MREKIVRNRKNILLTLALLILVAFNLGMRYLATRPRYKTLPEVKLVNQKEEITKGFAIMIPNESGDGYVEYEGDTWPSGYHLVESKCIDNNGELVENAVTFKDGKVELQTASSVYCTLYFDTGTATIEVLREKDTNGYLSEDLQGGMYRYQGLTYNSITNYICFGTKSQSECTNNEDKYMYRIIGITKQGQLYLIKNTPIKDGSNTTTFPWHSTSSFSDCNGTACDWPNVDLFKRLNGKGGTISKTNLFIDSTQYDYLKSENNVIDGKPQPSEWYDLIVNHKWMYGDLCSNSAYGLIGRYYYIMETGTVEADLCTDQVEYGLKPYKWTENVTAKISLMYVHDYLYSYPGGNPASYNYAKNGWLFGSDEWLSTRIGGSPTEDGRYYAHTMGIDGGVYHRVIYNRYTVRPVFYLSSKAKIVDGDGTKNSPYILSGN